MTSWPSRHAMPSAGGDPRDGLVWPPGSREAFLGDVRGLELGSDHQVFEDASFGVPMVYFHDWPDVTIHTNKDLPENLDATKLGRVAYLGAGIAWTLAALPDAEAARLLALARADADTRMVGAELRGALAEDGEDASVFRGEAAQVGAATLRSVGVLWPAVGAAAREAEARLLARVPPSPARGGPRHAGSRPQPRGTRTARRLLLRPPRGGPRRVPAHARPARAWERGRARLRVSQSRGRPPHRRGDPRRPLRTLRSGARSRGGGVPRAARPGPRRELALARTNLVNRSGQPLWRSVHEPPSPSLCRSCLLRRRCARFRCARARVGSKAQSP